MKKPSSFYLLALFSFLLLMASQAQQDTDVAPKPVADLLESYEKEITLAKERPDKVLQNEVAKIGAKFVLEGNAEAAKTLSTQVADKVAGRSIATDNTDLARLFELYDKARDAAILPVREKYTRHVDSLLQNPDGKDINLIVALGEAKKVILGEKPNESVPAAQVATEPMPVEPPAGNAAILSPASGKKVLEDLAMSRVWEYKTRSGTDLISFGKRGSVRWLRGGGTNPGVSTFNWKVDDDFIAISNTTEVRIDTSGSFGEVLYTTSNNRYRLHPSDKSVPD